MNSAKYRFVRWSLPGLLLLVLAFQNCGGGLSTSPLSTGGGILKAQDSGGSCDNGQPYEGLTCAEQNNQLPPTGGSEQGNQGFNYEVICKASTSTSAVAEIRWLAMGPDRQVLMVLRHDGQTQGFEALLNVETMNLSPVVEWTGFIRVLRVLQLDDMRARVQLRSVEGDLVIESLSCARVRLPQ